MKNRRWWSTVTVWVGISACHVLGSAIAVGCGEDENSNVPFSDAAALDVGTGSNISDAAVDRGIADTGTDTTTPDSGPGATDAGAVFASCKAALQANPAAPTGVYQIDPDGAGPQGTTSIFCDMTTDGGGWTLGLLRNSVDTGSYPTFASGYANLAALAVDPKVASANTATTPALAGWLDLNTFAYTDLVLEGFRSGASTFRSAPIAKTTLRIPFGQNGYYLYDDANGYFWCGGASSYTNDGTGQVNTPTGAPADCKGHTSLGNGWDFGGASYNTNLTACGGGSALMKAGPAEGFVGYPNPGAAHAFWVR